MDRVILHCDANSYYASVECLYTPEIRDKPVAVGGSVEARHGIILTKNALAKRCGVRTGEAIWQAKEKCPDLVCVQHGPLQKRGGPIVCLPNRLTIEWAKHDAQVDALSGTGGLS